MKEEELKEILKNLEERTDEFYEKLRVIEGHNYQKIYDSGQINILKRILGIPTHLNYNK